MDDPGTIEVHPASTDRFDDLASLMDQCWCAYWRLTSGEYRAADLDDRVALMAGCLGQGPAPGVLAYIDGRPVGWCGFGPRPEFRRLARSRTIPVVDDRPVWSIVCFLVRPGYRRRGVSRALLDGAIAYARIEGAVGLEAYPIDPGDGRADSVFGYVGFTHMFEAAGFRRVVETAAHSSGLARWLMRLDLESPQRRLVPKQGFEP